MCQNYTLGDFGAGGQRSRAGDALIDVEQHAREAAAGDWAYLAHTENRVAWHIPETPSSLQIQCGEHRVLLKRGSRLVGSRSTLVEGLTLAAEYMAAHPEGESRWA